MSFSRRRPPDSSRRHAVPFSRPADASIAVACLLWTLASPAAIASDPPATRPNSTPAELARWVAQLDDDDYLVRRDATERLILAGSPAAAPVAAALDEARVEQLARGLHVLHQLAISGKEQAEVEALQALDQLAENRSELVRNRVNRQIDSLVDIFQDRSLAELERLGAVVGRYPAAFGGFLADVPQELSIRIDDNWKGTPADLEHLRWLRDTHTVWLSGNKITDLWVPHLAAMPNVRHLRLHRTPVTDQGLHQLLSQLQALTRLDVWYSDITDAAFPDLTGRAMWERVRLYGTPKLTQASLQRIKQFVTEVDFRPGGGLLGIQPLTPGARQIRIVVAGSGADKAGVRVRDIVRTFDGVEVQDFTHLTRLIGQKGPNQTARVGLLRDGRELELPVVLGAWPFDAF